MSHLPIQHKNETTPGKAVSWLTGQGRKTADWLPFSRQFVLSADHLTTNQVVYKKEQSLKPNT